MHLKIKNNTQINIIHKSILRCTTALRCFMNTLSCTKLCTCTSYMISFMHEYHEFILKFFMFNICTEKPSAFTGQ